MPRYWDVYFGTEDDVEGDVGRWYPEQRQKLIGGRKIDWPEKLEMTSEKWRAG